MMKRNGGILENWWVSDIATPDGKQGQIVFGNIFADNNWPSGVDLRTSLVVKLDEESGTVETLNTVYRLGQKANVSA